MNNHSILNTRVIFRPFLQPAAGMRLFCFPYAGGGASAYHAWARLLPPDVELCIIQLPGRETRRADPPYTQFVTAVAALAEAIYPLLDKPAAFWGHSLGALLAFETAQTLRRSRQAALHHLFLSSRRPPQLAEPFPPIAGLPEQEFVAAIQSRYGGIPQPILQEPELMALFLPTLRADFALLESYVYREQPPLACAFTVLGGSEDPLVTTAGLRQWQQHTCGAFTQRQFSGGHFYLQAQRPALLELLAQTLPVQR